MRPELFLIEDAVFTSTSYEEVEATYEDMVELGIAGLPYPSIDIGFSSAVVFNLARLPPPESKKAIRDPTWVADNKRNFPWQLRLCIRDGIIDDVLFELRNGTYLSFTKLSDEALTTRSGEDLNEAVLKFARGVIKLLVVLLATRNIRKERVRDKLAALGVGKAKMRPVYTTTLRLPLPEDVTEQEQSEPRGPMRPHLRRGHIRRQHHGPRNQFVKKVWIEPTFVNADEAFMSTRTSYNCSSL